MNLLEYEAKSILQKFNIPVPAGTVVAGAHDQIEIPCVIKSQVPVGGRGKAGGVVVVRSEEEAAATIKRLLNLEIKGFTPTRLLAEELVAIERELYLSLTVNRATEQTELMAHKTGGVEIESHESGEFFVRSLPGKGIEGAGDALADYYDLPEQSFALQDLLENLYRCFVKSDATLLEINPLCLTTDGHLVAGDCKMTLDDSAAFRHPDWDFEAKPANRNFVVLDHEGTIASLANGAGLAMATVDAIAARDLRPANFLDIGGAATPETMYESFQQIAKLPEVTHIVINIFGGIVRCDDVAQAILQAQSQLPDLPRLVVRLSGNRSSEARELLASSGLVLHDTLESCLDAITEETTL